MQLGVLSASLPLVGVDVLPIRVPPPSRVSESSPPVLRRVLALVQTRELALPLGIRSAPGNPTSADQWAVPLPVAGLNLVAAGLAGPVQAVWARGVALEVF
jgi:hypothetical protein